VRANFERYFFSIFKSHEDIMTTFLNKGQPMESILLIILIAVLLAVLPTWPYSRTWGPFPSGLIGLIIVIVLVLLFLGKV